MIHETDYRISIGGNKKVGGEVIDAQQYILFFQNADGDFEAEMGGELSFLQYLVEHNILPQTIEMYQERMKEDKPHEPG